MSKYYVRIPVAGVWSVEVEADSEEAAIKAAMATEFNLNNLEEIDRYEQLYNGYVSFAPLDEAEVDLDEWDEGDDE